MCGWAETPRLVTGYNTTRTTRTYLGGEMVDGQSCVWGSPHLSPGCTESTSLLCRAWHFSSFSFLFSFLITFSAFLFGVWVWAGYYKSYFNTSGFWAAWEGGKPAMVSPSENRHGIIGFLGVLRCAFGPDLFLLIFPVFTSSFVHCLFSEASDTAIPPVSMIPPGISSYASFYNRKFTRDYSNSTQVAYIV
jgi:hypothetical protein